MSGIPRPASARDVARMRRALALARRGWGQTAPNPMVGAVVVRDGEVVGEGFHQRYGEAHAEVNALRAAGERARGGTVYVSLEPCAHHGKTPPCTDALIAAGVARVVVAVPDPDPVAGGGAERLRAAGIEVAIGVMEREARELNAPFFHARTAAPQPWVTLKLALSLDGALADAAGHSRWITGPASRREAHRLRAGHDVIAIGIGTALADDPSLTVRDAPAPRVPPLRVVFDRTARLPLQSALARTARELRTLVVCESPDPERALALEAAGVELLRVGSLLDGLARLHRAGIASVLVEGGAALAGALLGTACVHRMVIFQAPVVLGAGALGAFSCAPARDVREAPRAKVLARRRLGSDLMTVYDLEDLCSPD